jgi:aspartyl-tRNA(Asn)/glutamyl-tRNA(Gln) amidotransferase subunit B
MQDWEVVIGLEIHTQLKTQSKIFSGASTAFGAAPNTQACAIDLGFPGVLPMVNEAVYAKAVAFGLGIGADINLVSVFDRKNYFYPDQRATRSRSWQAPLSSVAVSTLSSEMAAAKPFGSPVLILRRTPASPCTKIIMARPALI